MAKNEETGDFIFEEYKSSLSAPLTKNQKVGFPELNKYGGKIVGKGKEEFIGGTKISSDIEIQIIRPLKSE